VYEPDPFAEPAFLSRLQKLLPMLASGQPAEAEAARRKLLEHLAHNRLTLTDVSRRLGEPLPPPQPQASFLQGSREISLERQLAIARRAKQEAETEAAQARARVAELQTALHQATLNVGRALQGRARARVVAAFGLCTAAVCLAVAGGAHVGPAVHQLLQQGEAEPDVQPTQANLDDLALRPGRNERLGTALVPDLAVRMTPNESADVRAFLTQGTRVVIVQQERVGAQTWLLIRSGSGAGWVRSGDVLH
jgi:hypothetical protein